MMIRLFGEAVVGTVVFMAFLGLELVLAFAFALFTASFTTILGIVIQRYFKKLDAKENKAAEQLNVVHQLVNSQWTEAQKENKRLKDELTALLTSQSNAQQSEITTLKDEVASLRQTLATLLPAAIGTPAVPPSAPEETT